MVRPSRPHRWMAVVATSLAVTGAACGDDDTESGGPDLPEPDCPAEIPDGGDRLAQLQERGTVTVGIANEVPYGYQAESGRVTGEAPELARSIFQCLGVGEIRATVVDFGALIGGLQAGQYDMIAAGMFITPDRASQVSFTDPDYCATQSFAVAAGNPLGLSDYESIEEKGATLAVMAGAVELGYAEVAGVSRDNLNLNIDVNFQYDALEVGRVDAVAGTTATVNQQVMASRGKFETTEPFVPLNADGEEDLGCGGFAFRNDNTELRDAFNEELHRQQEDGTVMEIVTAFGFGEADVEAAEQVTVEDLAG